MGKRKQPAHHLPLRLRRGPGHAEDRDRDAGEALGEFCGLALEHAAALGHCELFGHGRSRRNALAAVGHPDHPCCGCPERLESCHARLHRHH